MIDAWQTSSTSLFQSIRQYARHGDVLMTLFILLVRFILELTIFLFFLFIFFFIFFSLSWTWYPSVSKSSFFFLAVSSERHSVSQDPIASFSPVLVCASRIIGSFYFALLKWHRMDGFLAGRRQTTSNMWDCFFKKENENQRKEDYDDILLFLPCSRKEGIGGVLSFFSFLSPMTTLCASYSRILAYLIWMLI